ncbi:MAG: DNA-3-methyladenine glycosylase 2 family protein [Clostridiales bacterium]|nr:DNA-3-methyladenine glycosylase 2 family protein [Clostridiales bacterium]
MNFRYGTEEADYLSRRDPALGAWIQKLGVLEWSTIPDVFEALMSSITAQQVSGRAYRTVWGRLTARGLTTPGAYLAIPQEELAALGVGPKKAKWMRRAAERAEELSVLPELSDEDAIKKLVSFDGVGRWTAEMLLIFSLNRMDILSQGDFGIRKALCALHGDGADRDFARFRELYAPYASVASLYLWEIANGEV